MRANRSKSLSSTLLVALALQCAVSAAWSQASRILREPGEEQATFADAQNPQQNADPWEGFNRSIFAFNEVLDRDMLNPLASAYVGLVPELARTGVTNVFHNFNDLWSAVNQLLQGKLENAVAMTMRFATNSVFGVAGLIDIGTAVGMERKPEDFGQTLGVWGFSSGNFLMLPLFGPSTVRDTVGLPLDIAATPSYAIGSGFRPAVSALQIIEVRARLLPASRLLDRVALDRYSFVRDAYLSRRLNLVYDGNPPELSSPSEESAPAAPADPQ